MSILDSHWSSTMDFVHVLRMQDKVSLLHSCATQKTIYTWAPKSPGDVAKKGSNQIKVPMNQSFTPLKF